MGSILLAFVSGVIIETLYALGVLVISGRKAALAGLYSMLWGAAFLVGAKESWDFGWPALAWIIGLGAGAYAARPWTSPRC